MWRATLRTTPSAKGGGTVKNRVPNLVDFFCGAGGLSQALTEVGLDAALASDSWAPAAQTYRQNHPDVPFLQNDIRDVSADTVLQYCGGRTPDVVAGGQGRLGEELLFPLEAKASGYTPVLIVLDPTTNPKLTELASAYRDAGGETFIGEAAWSHLKGTATSSMATFIDKYVREPLEEVLSAFPTAGLVPPLTLTDKGSSVEFPVGSSEWSIERRPSDDSSPDVELPDDIARDLPGIEGD